MTKYFLSKVTIIAMALFAAAACVKVDDTLGDGFIPEGQMLKLEIDNDFQINTYNIIRKDSLVASNLSSVYLGSSVDPLTGSVTGEALFQMVCPYFSSEAKLGTSPVIDSIILTFGVNGVTGKSNVEQTFDLYELKENIYYDTTYYIDFDPAGMYNTTPLLTFTHSGEDSYITKHITDQDFFSRLADTTGYTTYTGFHERFKGFYIKSRTPGSDAAVYNISLSGSYLNVYYHNQNETPDTTMTSYYFSPSSYPNQSINIVKYDHTNADPSLRIDDMSIPVSRNIIQGFGGLSTYMEFTQESVDRIKKTIRDNGYKDIVINQAKLEMSFPDTKAESMNQSFDRLGIYTDVKKLQPIVDYNYSREEYGYTIAYGGYIDRSNYKYEMDITMYVQRLFRDEYDKRGVILAPSVDYYWTLRHVELNGSASPSPMKLKITYTMVK